MNLKQSLRIIFRNKTFSILNIFGLTVGITATALIFLWVEYQTGFNRELPNSKNLYKIGQNQQYGDEINTFFVACGPLSRTLDAEFPEIKRNTREGGDGTTTFVLEKENKAYSEYGQFMDATAFDMIGLQFVRGNKQTAFEPAFPIVISEKMAEKMFGKEDPLGKTLKTDDHLYEVTGVFKDLPKNISFSFDWLCPFRILENDYAAKGWVNKDSWRSNWQSCYVELLPGTDVNVLNKRLKNLQKEKTAGEGNAEYFVYQLNKLRLYGQFRDGKSTGSGYIRTVRLFAGIGLVILAIACINFMNLSTARSQKRATEVGVRKTFGAKRDWLIRFFLGESALLSILSLLISVGLIYLCLPAFNRLVNIDLQLNLLNPYQLFGLLGIGLICTFLAGSYPAFYLSSFSPINTLKKQKLSKGGSVVWISKGLVVTQFATAFILICTTFVIYLQIRHGQNREMGIKKDNLVTFATTPEIINSFNAVRNELLGTGFVESTALSSQSLINIWNNGGGLKWQGKDPDINPLISNVHATPGLIEAAGLKLTEGKDLADNDSTYILVNQTLADIMGSEGRVGGRIGWSDDPNEQYEIKGIVNNFVFNDMYTEKYEPVIFYYYPGGANFIFTRLKEGVNQVEALAKIKTVLKNFSPNEAHEPTYMDDRFERMFAGQRTIGKLGGLFAGLAIFISCLGLFGLSAFSAEQRTKEIGIRKVLGATVWDILTLLGKSYMGLIGVSLVIGIPLAWYITNKYLNDYSYKITLGWSLFAGVAILVTLIAILTVSFQSLRAAMANPVKSIKVE